MKKEQGQKIILAVLLGIGLVYLYANYLFLPQWKNIQRLQQQLTTRQGYYSRLLSYKHDPSGLQQQVQGLQSQLKESGGQNPIGLDKPQILVYLYSVAKHYAVVPQSVAFEPLQNKGFYQELPLTFVAKGKPSDVLAMIESLQQGVSPRLTTHSVSLKVDKGVMSVNLKLAAYALTGGNGAVAQEKPAFMYPPIGIGSVPQMFQP